MTLVGDMNVQKRMKSTEINKYINKYTYKY